MTLRAILILMPLILAACDGPAGNVATTNVVKASYPAPLDPAKVLQERWGSLYSNPNALIAAANGLGYKNGPMTATGDGSMFRSEGMPIDVPFPRVARPSTATFLAEGKTASQVDRFIVEYTLHARNNAEAERAQQGFRNLFFGIMQRRETYPPEAVNTALREGTPLKAALPIGAIEIATTPMGSFDRRFTATVTRTASAASAERPRSDARM